jgi:hypothetical protein
MDLDEIERLDPRLTLNACRAIGERIARHAGEVEVLLKGLRDSLKWDDVVLAYALSCAMGSATLRASGDSAVRMVLFCRVVALGLNRLHLSDPEAARHAARIIAEACATMFDEPRRARAACDA